MIIRRANYNDIKEIMSLLLEVGNVHANIRPDLFIKDKSKYNIEELNEIIIDDSKPIFVYVNNDNELCGYAFCLLSEISGNNLVSYKNLYIDDLCVKESKRHNGIGYSLYKYVLSFAKQIGCYNVTLNVWNGNDDANKFYNKCGLKIQKTVMEQIL